MHLDELKAAVQASLSEDFDTAYDRFFRESGDRRLLAFLAYLTDTDQLDDHAAGVIQAALERGVIDENTETGTLAQGETSSVPIVPDDETAPPPAEEAQDEDEDQDQDQDQDEDSAEGERPRRRLRRRPEDHPSRSTGTRRRSRRSTGSQARGTGTGAGGTGSSGTDTGVRRVRRRTEEGAPPRLRTRDQAGSATGKTGRGYDFIGFVGEGAMGKVRLAKDLDLQRVVAYKEMSEEILSNRTLAAKFYAEAQITAQLDHPNIVPIYDLDETESGALAYAMKLIKGKTLEDLIEECWAFCDQKKPYDEGHSLSTRLDMFLKVCEAMHFAHVRGVIHRDLKPENIMIGPYGEVYVMDWGIARVVTPEEGATPTAWVTLEDQQKAEGEIIIGTPQYMSPEQADGVTEDLTPASDQYALGLILYELVTLRQAVTGKTPMAIISRQQEGEKDPMRHYGRDSIPPELKAIVEKATAFKPEDRYASVNELAEDIRRYRRGEAVRAKPDTFLQMILRWMQNHRELTLLGIVAGFLFFAIVTLGSQIYYQGQRIAAAEREEALSQVITSVATQSALIDGEFVRYEGLLGVLAAASVEMLARTNPGDAQLTWDHDFDRGEVPSAEDSPFYQMPISVEQPVALLAPGADQVSAEANLKRLAPLGRYFRTVLLRSHSEVAATYTRARADRLLRDIGVPIAWAHVGLGDGAYMNYPGHGGYPDNFDPRTRPWYELVRDARVPLWGAPYIDGSGLGLILPCSKALYDDDDRRLGVASIDITFDHIIERLLEIDRYRADTESFLLNDEGEIVVRSSRGGREFRGSTLTARRIRMPVFDQPTVVEQIRDRQSGYVEEDIDGEDTLTIYHRMSTLGWYYVVRGPTDDLL